MSVDLVVDFLTRFFTVENALAHKDVVAGITALLLVISIAVLGAVANRRIAHGWLRVLGDPSGVLARNFAAHGGINGSPGADALWWRDSGNIWQLYASGRRYCTSALLTLDLRPRQDALAQLQHLLSPRQDTLQLVVSMAEGTMPQTVLAIGPPKRVRALLRDEPKLEQLARLTKVSRERVPASWPAADRLAVAAEHPGLLYDLVAAEPALGRALSSRLLQSVLISSEGGAPGTNGSGACVSVTAALPPLEQADELQALLSCVFTLVDLIGSYKASPEMKRRAQEARAELQKRDANKDGPDQQELAQQRRMERIEAERAKARSAGPAALAKFEERLQAKMRSKEMRRRTLRM